MQKDCLDFVKALSFLKEKRLERVGIWEVVSDADEDGFIYIIKRVPGESWYWARIHKSGDMICFWFADHLPEFSHSLIREILNLSETEQYPHYSGGWCEMSLKHIDRILSNLEPQPTFGIE